MAHYLKDNELADEYLSIYEKGKKWLNSNLFNGDYFYQEIDLKNKSLLDEYINDTPDLTGVLNTYWCNEFNEIKYQVSDGCIVDQVIAQWHSNCLEKYLIKKKQNQHLRLFINIISKRI